MHVREWNRDLGTIWRSKRFDPRNKNGKLASVYPGTLGDYLSYSSIILELQTGKFANIAERSGRAQDKEGGGGLETLRRDGYM